MSTRARLLLALAALLFVWNTWGYDLWAPDEPYFAEGAREMLVDGHWAVPHVNGLVTPDKPPLFFWLIALLSLPLGHISSFTARTPSAAAAVVSIALTMRLGRRLAGERAGDLAGLVLMTTYMFWDKARTAQIDSLLCCLVLVALSAFESLRSGAERPLLTGIVLWGACALAVIAKGPVGVIVPAGIGAATLAMDGALRTWRRYVPAAGPAVFAGIVSAWAIAATLGGDGEYSVWGAFKQHALDRAIFGMHHVQPPWYFLEVMPFQLFPWTLLLPAALYDLSRRRSAESRFLLAWVAFPFLFFSAVTEKRELYLLPLCPAVAILVARFLTSLPSERWSRNAVRVTCGVIAAVGAALPFAVLGRPVVPMAVATALAVGLVLTGLAAAWRSSRAGLLPSVRALATGTLLVYLLVAAEALPSLQGIKSVEPFAARFKELTAATRKRGDPVLAFRIGNLSDAIAFFTDGVYVRDATLFDLELHLGRPDPTFALADAGELSHVRPDIRERLTIVESATFGPTRLVLVTNGRPAM
ncbi:MAG TPA: glycosyltransferase family 39 protein [Verrucomicrobiae bacterium]|nr:glycosyltransferase family 39 protein [Verrucomicrobiae bacterium]